MDDQEILNTKKQDYWLGRTITTTNRFSTLSEENIEEDAKQSTERKTTTNFRIRCKRIKLRIELLNEITKDKYHVKILYNDQVRIQTTEGSVYPTIVKALMEKIQNFTRTSQRKKEALE